MRTREEQDKRWVEDFREVPNQADPDTEANIGEDAITELLFDEICIREEVRNAVKKLKANEALGLDEIHPDILKCGSDVLVTAYAIYATVRGATSVYRRIGRLGLY